MSQTPTPPELLNDLACMCSQRNSPCGSECTCSSNEQSCTAACTCGGLINYDDSDESTVCANPFTKYRYDSETDSNDSDTDMWS